MLQSHNTLLTAGDCMFALCIHIVIITINLLSYVIPKP